RLSSPRAGASNVGAITIPGLVLLPLQSNLLHLSAFRVELRALAPGSVALRGNQLRAQATTAPLVEVEHVIACLFDQNECEISGADTERGGIPIGHIRSQQVGAANNRLIGGPNQIALRLESKSFAVLGNLTSGPIEINGGAPPPPWDA